MERNGMANSARALYNALIDPQLRSDTATLIRFSHALGA